MFTLKYWQRKVLVTIPEQVYMDQRKIAAWLHFILNLAVTLSERLYDKLIMVTIIQNCRLSQTEELCLCL